MKTIANRVLRGLAALALAGGLTMATSAGATSIMYSGTINYTLGVNTVTLSVDRISNNDTSGTSGTIRLELWAFPAPYDGTPQLGYRLAASVLGPLPYLQVFQGVNTGPIAYVPPPTGTWIFAILITEYDAGTSDDGFSTRDWQNFDQAVVIGPAAATVVEYYWASRDHYFITAAPAEIAALDASAPGGWVRTGKTFNTLATAQTGTSPVCRFYIPPAYGDSHFYGRGTAECNATHANHPEFVYESPSVMYMYLPNLGVCGAGTIPVYRVFDARVDTNHRYTIDRAVRDQMVALGWVAEGDGPDLVVMCAPQ
jgi:Repeat of unknown function (DUF5648)